MLQIFMNDGGWTPSRFLQWWRIDDGEEGLILCDGIRINLLKKDTLVHSKCSLNDTWNWGAKRERDEDKWWSVKKTSKCWKRCVKWPNIMVQELLVHLSPLGHKQGQVHLVTTIYGEGVPLGWNLFALSPCSWLAYTMVSTKKAFPCDKVNTPCTFNAPFPNWSVKAC